MRFVFASLALCFAAVVPSCVPQSSGTLAQCGSGTIGAAGGTVTSPSGAALTIGRSVLTTDVSISVCVLEVGRVPRQRSPVVRFSPVDLPLAGSVLMTMPIDDPSTAPTIGEVRRAISDDFVETEPLAFPAPNVATLSAFRLGEVRLMDTLTVFDGGVDSSTGAADVNRPDAPRPVGPVVTGPDLTPADYTCLGMGLATTGPARDVTVHLVDWADGSIRGGYTVATAPTATAFDSSALCTGTGCDSGTSDAAGDVTLSVAEGPVFVGFTPPTMGTDPGRMAALQWIDGLVLTSTATTLRVEALSQRTANAINMSIGFGGQYLLGRVRDCDGALVQRARVRVFDASGFEITTSFFGGPPIVYGNGLGFPGGTADRSTRDGVYMVPLSGANTTMRIEAWGHLTLDGEDVLLACEAVTIPGFSAVLADLGPMRSDASSTCGSVP